VWFGKEEKRKKEKVEVERERGRETKIELVTLAWPRVYQCG
jgi:hypothetical protein